MRLLLLQDGLSCCSDRGWDCKTEVILDLRLRSNMNSGQASSKQSEQSKQNKGASWHRWDEIGVVLAGQRVGGCLRNTATATTTDQQGCIIVCVCSSTESTCANNYELVFAFCRERRARDGQVCNAPLSQSLVYD